MWDMFTKTEKFLNYKLRDKLKFPQCMTILR